MSWIAVLVLSVLLTLAGRALPLRRLALQWMAGAVLFHLVLTTCDALGISWGRIVILVPLGCLVWLGFRRREPGRVGPGDQLRAGQGDQLLPSDLGWGDAAALFALTAFTLFAPTLWTVTPDFVYHWGLKGEHFFLARGVDYDWLAVKEWSWVIHPDYPNLLPELFAGSALLAGAFEAPAQMLWSVLVFALILLASREALKAASSPSASSASVQMGIAITAFALAGFGLGHRMAGAADGMPALALVAALPAVFRVPDREGDMEIGIAAAFAAASKIEGLPLAAFLVAVQLVRLVRRIAAERRLDVRGALWLTVPTALVAIPWAIRTFDHGLYQNFNTGGFDASRAPVILRGLIDSTVGENWHGLPAILLALPLLLLVRRTRTAAVVVSMQLAFYLWIYFTAAVDTQYQVISSFPRLAMHLIPTVIVLIATLSSGAHPVEEHQP